MRRRKSVSQHPFILWWFLLLVVGVALMVGILFFLMLAVEQTFQWLSDQLSNCFGCHGKRADDPEDPAQAAALVGSFKRYKN